jgi:hypothetical protein
VKGITAASQVVKQGGRILIFGACAEGAGAAEFREMMLQYRSHEEFLKAVDGAPVTIDQWQLEKLALAARKAEIWYCVPGLPSPYHEALWGPAYRDPAEAVARFLGALPKGSRVAVIPEGPYVLASAAEMVEA